jgi:aspartyl/asparaginyl-tRNA synthetase
MERHTWNKFKLLTQKIMLAKQYKLVLGSLTNVQAEKLLFLQLRDGTAYFQGIVVKNEVGEEMFQAC